MTEFLVFDWNTQGNFNYTGYTSLKKRKEVLSKVRADIITLQEFPHAQNKIRTIKNLAGYNCFCLEPGNPNNNVILSKFPILSAAEIKFPVINGHSNFRGCLRADIKIGDQILRLYNCHFEIFGVAIDSRQKQLNHIIADSQNFQGPTIICGDMNTTIPKAGLNRSIISFWHHEPKAEMMIGGKYFESDERNLFNKLAYNKGFKEVFDICTPTWLMLKTQKWEMFKLKLDWFLIKNLIVKNSKLYPYISDHRPLETILELPL